MAEVFLFHHAQGQIAGFHAFADSSLPTYDEGATRLLTKRVLAFLEQRD
jgi:dienelactone hydrolase